MIFAEGITFLDGKGYLLTWKNQRGFIFDPATLQISGSFNYSGEGWGLTNDGKSLIMSNGSSELRWISPKDFQTEKTIPVTLNGEPLNKLNELEWANNLIFSNIWQSNSIVAINPQSGSVLGQIDFSELAKNEVDNPAADVLNGIAYDQNNNSYLVTGKNWQWIYRIKILFQEEPNK
jgi:glutamine cyclotransferase